jgi:peptide/nickel transport system permease protein
MSGKIRSFIRAGSRGRKSRNACIGGGIVLCFVVIAILAPLVTPYAKDDRPAKHLRPPYQPPSGQHIAGTDRIGRDLFSRIVFGSRISLRIGLVSVGIALAIGTCLGVLAGYPGGWPDMLIMRFMDIFMAFPAILLAIIIVTIMGSSLTNLMIAIGLVTVPQYARLVRGQVLKIKQQEYVVSASAIGLPHPQIILRYILPNCMPILIVQSTFSMATAILDAAGLSFLGLGPEPSQPEWGVMLSDGIRLFIIAPWVPLFTGFAILLVVIGLNLLGDGLRDMLDPRLRRL